MTLWFLYKLACFHIFQSISCLLGILAFCLWFCLHASILNLKLTDFMVDYFMTISSLCQLAEVCRGNGAGAKQAPSTDTMNESVWKMRKPQNLLFYFSLIQVVMLVICFWNYFHLQNSFYLSITSVEMAGLVVMFYSSEDFSAYIYF